MSEIKNVGYTWMALNTLKCNCVSPLPFKGLTPSLGVISFEYVDEPLYCLKLDSTGTGYILSREMLRNTRYVGSRSFKVTEFSTIRVI